MPRRLGARYVRRPYPLFRNTHVRLRFYVPRVLQSQGRILELHNRHLSQDWQPESCANLLLMIETLNFHTVKRSL